MAVPHHRTDLIEYAMIEQLLNVGKRGKGALFKELLNLFQKNAPPSIAKIKLFLEQHDGLSLSHEAHSLKGSSANLGAKHLAEICQTIEVLGKENRLQEASEKISELDRVYLESLEELKKLIPV